MDDLTTISHNVTQFLHITTFRYVYLIIFVLPLNIHLLESQSGVIIQWAFFRLQATASANYVIPITTSLSSGLLDFTLRNTLHECFLFLGSLCFVVSYILLFYRTTEPVKKAGLLTVSGSVLVTCAYVLPFGWAGISIPAGMPFILGLGVLMYWHQPDIPDTRPDTGGGAGPDNLTGTGSTPAESTPGKAVPPAGPGIMPGYYVSLVMLNFVTNFIFLPYYGFTGDDWSQFFYEFEGVSFSNLLFESHRPVFYLILKTMPVVFGNNPVFYYLFNFMITSVLLLIVFITVKSLLGKTGITSESWSFLIAVLFCVLFNKGELYAFGSIIPNNIAFVLYFLSWYFYINSEEKPFLLPLSLISFTIALFTYELGMILPGIFLIYTLCFEKSCKKPLVFFLPVIFYGIVRFTNWGGFGYVLKAGSGITPLNLLSSLPTGLYQGRMNMVMLIDSFAQKVNQGVLGLDSLPRFLLAGLIVLDVLVASAIIWVLNRHLGEEPEKPEFNALPLILTGSAGIVLSFVLISLNGFMAERYLVFIDLFACLIVVSITLKCAGKKAIVHGLFFIIIFCLIINQGLCFNWVISGTIQHNFNDAVLKNSENISPYRFVYVNRSDLQVVAGNYLNAGGLHSWSILSMMQNAGIETGNKTLIYNVDDENARPVETIENRSYFEFNRSNVDLSAVFSR